MASGGTCLGPFGGRGERAIVGSIVWGELKM